MAITRVEVTIDERGDVLVIRVETRQLMREFTSFLTGTIRDGVLEVRVGKSPESRILGINPDASAV